MDTKTFISVLKEIEIHLLEISGCLSICNGLTPSDDQVLESANANAVATIQGIRIIHNALEYNPEST